MYCSNRNINAEKSKRNITKKSCEWKCISAGSSFSLIVSSSSTFCVSGARLKTSPWPEKSVALENQNENRKMETKLSEDEVQGTVFGKALYNLTHSDRVMDDLIFGRRVGFYELRGEIGSGNFSQVRLGIHDLTKGETFLPAFSFFFNLLESQLHGSGGTRGRSVFTGSKGHGVKDGRVVFEFPHYSLTANRLQDNPVTRILICPMITTFF